jgi:NitT/TauT family transport system permease protein
VRLQRWLLVGVLTLAWELLARSGLFSDIIFPQLSEVARGLWLSLTGAGLLAHLRVTILEIVAAFALATTCGVVLGLLMGRVRPLGYAGAPFLALAFSVPLIVLAPFFTIAFGLGMTSKIMFAAVYGFFPICMTTFAQARNVDPSLLQLGRSLGAGRVQTLRKLVVPSCFPGIAAGLESGMALCVIGVLAMEMLSSYAGIGYLLQRATTGIRTGEVYGLVLLTLLLGYGCNRAIHAVALLVRKERALA